MTVLINVVLPVFLIIGVAALTQLRLKFNARSLSRAAFYLFSPALIFDALASTQISGAELGLIGAELALITVALWVLGGGVARALGLQGKTRAAFLAATLLMNAGNYGLSVSQFAYGTSALGPASVYFAGSAVISATIGVFVSARGQASVIDALRRVASMPLLYAAALGLAFSIQDWVLPEFLSKPIHLLGQGSIPVMLVVLGIWIADLSRSESTGVNAPALASVTVLRLLVAPGLTWAGAELMGLGGVARDVTLLQSAMPTAVITTILATEFDTDPSFAALSVVITTLGSLVTVTLLLNWLI